MKSAQFQGKSIGIITQKEKERIAKKFQSRLNKWAKKTLKGR